MKRLDFPKIVGENIKRLRDERNLKNEFLASMLGVTPQYLCGIIGGARGLSANRLEKVCEVLGVSHPYELFLLPDETDGDLIRHQLIKEIAIMCREDVAQLCAFAVSLNAARGIKPE